MKQEIKLLVKNVFDKNVTQEMIERINKLTNASTAVWGTMTVAQMLAHLNVTYELDFEDKHKKPNFILKFILKKFVKNAVVNETPYKHNLQTASFFLMKTDKDFEFEKNRLINFINQVQQLGAAHYHNRESHSFGALTKDEWNNMFYKHFDHHMNQFSIVDK